MTLVVDALLPADIDRCAELEQLLFAGDDPWSAAAFRSELSRRHNHYFAARLPEVADLIGYAGITLLGNRFSPESEVHTIGVAPGHRRLGTGRALLAKLLTVADKHGGPVYLEVRTDNDPAIGLYQAHGFTIVGTRRNYYQPSGADAYTMCRKPGDAR